MFSVLTNIYKNHNYSQPQENWSFFLTTIDVPCVHYGWHGTHRYDIQVFSHIRVNMSQHGHYLHSHRLAAEMWTTIENNLLGKKFFELFLLSVQFS
jgi:hypothetical protein